MAECTRAFLSRDEAMEVALVAFRQPERFAAYLSTRGGEHMTPADFAAFVLQCARRIAAGPAS